MRTRPDLLVAVTAGCSEEEALILQQRGACSGAAAAMELVQEEAEGLLVDGGHNGGQRAGDEGCAAEVGIQSLGAARPHSDGLQMVHRRNVHHLCSLQVPQGCVLVSQLALEDRQHRLHLGCRCACNNSTYTHTRENFASILVVSEPHVGQGKGWWVGNEPLVSSAASCMLSALFPVSVSTGV